MRTDRPAFAGRPAAVHPAGAFTVDPRTRRGGVTRMTVTSYDVAGPDGALAPFETFTLQRPRGDARRS